MRKLVDMLTYNTIKASQWYSLQEGDARPAEAVRTGNDAAHCFLARTINLFNGFNHGTVLLILCKKPFHSSKISPLLTAIHFG